MVDDESLETFLSALEHWLENYWRPQTLRDSLFAELKIFGHGVLYPQVFRDLEQWCLFQQTYEWEHLPIIIHLKKMADALLSVLRNKRYCHGSKF